MRNKKMDIGMIGLGTMGAALAHNFESHGFSVVAYNRHFDKAKAFAQEFPDNVLAARSVAALVTQLKRPRKIMIMLPAGQPIDDMLATLIPHLQKGDIIIDGGNSHYSDTARREATLKKKGVLFMGCGVSGGEAGALHGPSLMPGGSTRAWQRVRPLLEAIAAKDASGAPCVTHVGPGAAGHYVKMVHNGIEYGILQLMAETYALLHDGYRFPTEKIGDLFASWNKGKLKSFLFEIAVPVLQKKDDRAPGLLVEHILDRASNKGTGAWASVDALQRGVAIPTITEAVYARYMSAEKDLRVQLADRFPRPKVRATIAQTQIDSVVRDALFAAMLSTYAQGFDLIARASEQEKWHIDLNEIARIWQGGCIIRANLLHPLHDAFSKKESAAQQHLLLQDSLQGSIAAHTPKLQTLVAQATSTGIALPAFAASLYYLSTMTTAHLPANFIQGLRDYFGGHTYERIDMTGSFRGPW